MPISSAMSAVVIEQLQAGLDDALARSARTFAFRHRFRSGRQASSRGRRGEPGLQMIERMREIACRLPYAARARQQRSWIVERAGDRPPRIAEALEVQADT